MRCVALWCGVLPSVCVGVSVRACVRVCVCACDNSNNNNNNILFTTWETQSALQ